MRVELKCSCGASIAIRGLFLRDVDVQDWLDRHDRCIGSRNETQEEELKENE